MSVKKKRLLTMVGLILLMVAMGALYFFVPKGEEKDTEDTPTQMPETQTITVDKIDKDAVTELSMQTSEGTVTLVKKKDAWHFEEDSETPVNTEMVDTMLSSLSPVTAMKELSAEGAKPADYGLDNPGLIITVKTAEKAYTYSLGLEVPVVGGYYGQNGDSAKVYALSTSLFEAFNQTKNELIQMETVPEITPDYITYLKVDNKKETVFETKEVSKNERVDETSKWNIVKPYELPVAVNVSNFTTLLETYTTYAFNRCVDYHAKDEAKYGLDKPTRMISLEYYTVKSGAEPTPTPSATSTSEIPEKQREYHTFKLLIGNKSDDGYYVKIDGGKGIYLMSEDTVNSYMEPDVYTYMDHCIYTKLATELKGFDVIVGDKEIKVTRKDAGEKKDGVKQNSWYINGKEADTSSEEAETKFLTPFSKAYLLELSGKIKPSVKPVSDEPALTIVYHEKNRDITIRYLPYDGDNFYRVDKNGEMQFVTDKRAVDDAADAFVGMLDLIK